MADFGYSIDICQRCHRVKRQRMQTIIKMETIHRNDPWPFFFSTTDIFPVVMYGLESWTTKKPECWRIDAFELWWRRLLRVPWTPRRSNQSILKEISPEYSLEGLTLRLNTLATWCEELTHLKRPWWWERLKIGGEGDDRGWDGWMASPTQWIWVLVGSGS